MMDNRWRRVVVSGLGAVLALLGCRISYDEISVGAGGTFESDRLCTENDGYVGVRIDSPRNDWGVAFVAEGGTSTSFYSTSGGTFLVIPEEVDAGTCGTVVIRNLSDSSSLTASVTYYTDLGEPTPGQTGVPVDDSVPAPQGDGMWIGRDEIMALPTSGNAWDALEDEAYSDWGTASLSDNNAKHDTSTLAGALVAVRLGDDELREKTRKAIMSCTNVGFARVLEMSRNITSYVVAADIVGLSESDDDKFRSFLSGLRTKDLTGHSGGDNLHETALYSANNWGGMARAAAVAINLYLGDETKLAELVVAQRAFLGEDVSNEMKFTDTDWHASSDKAGINRRGAKIDGQNVDGVIPEDQRRTGGFASPAPKGSYPWEALQGALVTSALLARAGKLSIHAGDDALVRAFTWLYDTNDNPPEGDDQWQPWLLNDLAGTDFATTGGGVGKNMGWTDWTHQ